MQGTIAFIAALCVIAVSVLWAVSIKRMRYKRGRLLTPVNILFSGVAIASLIMFIPIYSEMFDAEKYGFWKMFLLSVHNTIRLFLVDGEFSIILDNIGLVTKELQDTYAMLAAVLFVLAPFLTFSFVLSFFNNVSAYKDYYFRYFADTYVFSELNERSIELARSLKQNKKNRSIVFTDVFESDDERTYELIAQAYEIGAILFKKDIAVVNFAFHSKKSKLMFFIIGQDDDENVKQTLTLIQRYQENENVSVYVFTTSMNGELLLSKYIGGNVKVRRINEVQSLISRHLYDNGMKVFQSAADQGKEKLISAVIVGMGRHGKEMAKALSWLCQMDGYRLEMNIFDKDTNAEEKFCYECPELMHPDFNNNFDVEGEAHYSIKIHAGVDVETKGFLDKLEEIDKITYVFVALGDDERNISIASKLRSWLLKKEQFPEIDAVMKNADKKNALQGVTNYSGQEYKISFIGDTVTSYSEEVIFESDIEMEALKRHLKWGKEEEFWKFEYNYRSSVASAIHKKMRTFCEIPGCDKEPDMRTETERQALRVLEHRRWNAYMRAEGFTHAEKRNNLAKTHHCLVPFDQLSEKDQKKDDD